MEDTTAIQRIKNDDDPRRCQHMMRTGQCINISTEGSNFCLVHGGNKAVEAAEAKKLRNYRIQRYNIRLGELRSSNHIKDLRDEVAILRILLEEKMNLITNSNQLALQTGAISDLVVKIEKVVTSCQRLEEKTGIMLDKNRVVQMAEQIIAIITKHIEDTEVLELLADEFEKIFT